MYLKPLFVGAAVHGAAQIWKSGPAVLVGIDCYVSGL